MDLAFWAVSVYLVVLALIEFIILLARYGNSKLIFQKHGHINSFHGVVAKVRPMPCPGSRPSHANQTLKLSPHEQLDVALGLLNLKPPEIKAFE